MRPVLKVFSLGGYGSAPERSYAGVPVGTKKIRGRKKDDDLVPLENLSDEEATEAAKKTADGLRNPEGKDKK